MIIILGLILIIILGLLFGYYYYKLFKRFYCLFKQNITKKIKYILIFISIIFTLCTINLFSIIGIFLIHFIVISLIIDLIFFLIKKVYKKINNVILLRIYSSSIIPLVITGIVFGYGYFNIRNIVETRYTVYTEKEIGEDLRILLITDTHYETIFKKEKLDEYKKRLSAVNADIIILGGDIVDESTTQEGMEDIFNMLGQVKNKYGIYYVTGNHDEQQYSNKKNFNKEELDDIIEKNNIIILDEKYVKINDDVIIAGRKDYSYGNRKNVEDILFNVDNNKYVIMVDHQPIEYDQNIDAGVDLILSGHTHAGQVFPVSLFIKLFHTADLAYGNQKFENMEAVVSSGMAGWGYPIRTEKHSEYVVIDVKKK